MMTTEGKRECHHEEVAREAGSDTCTRLCYYYEFHWKAGAMPSVRFVSFLHLIAAAHVPR